MCVFVSVFDEHICLSVLDKRVSGGCVCVFACLGVTYVCFCVYLDDVCLLGVVDVLAWLKDVWCMCICLVCIYVSLWLPVWCICMSVCFVCVCVSLSVFVWLMYMCFCLVYVYLCLIGLYMTVVFFFFSSLCMCVWFVADYLHLRHFRRIEQYKWIYPGTKPTAFHKYYQIEIWKANVNTKVWVRFMSLVLNILYFGIKVDKILLVIFSNNCWSSN